MIIYFCTCTYPFSDGIADGWIRILAWAFGKVSGSTDALSSREGLKKGEESDASDEHDGGGSFDQRIDFQVSAGCSWYGAIAEGWNRRKVNEGCRRRRCGGACGASIDASDSKRFHLDLSRRSAYGRFVGRTKKKDFFRPKDIFSLAAVMRNRRDSTS